MVRLLQALVFLLPFAAYGLWLWSGRRYTHQLLWGTVGAMLVLMVGAAWLELSRAVPPDMVYIPPRMEDGRIIPGYAVPRAAPGEPFPERPTPERPSPPRPFPERTTSGNGSP